MAAPGAVRAVGRVVFDSDELLLEGGGDSSGGGRVRLGCAPLGGRAPLYPGQVVAVEGVNPTGFALLATTLVTAAPGADPGAGACAPAPAPLLLVAAAGPFARRGVPEHAPLDALLSFCAAARPGVLLCVGPFAERGGDQPAGAAFAAAAARLGGYAAAASSWGGVVVCVASPRDAGSPPVLPQPPLPFPPPVVAAPDPALLRFDGWCAAGVCGADVLRALAGCARDAPAPPPPPPAPGAPAPPDRLATLAAQLAGQGTFVPAHPCAPWAAADVGLGCPLPFAPHLLLLPGDLAPFAKLLPPGRHVVGADGAPRAGEGRTTVAVNPGRLVRGAGGGTFAVVSISPGGGSVAESTRVDVYKLAC